MPELLTILPPLVAIGLAITTREVVFSLLAGIFLAETLLASFNPALGALQTIDRIAGVFADPGNARILIFCLLVGSLLEIIERSGGVAAFVRRLAGSRLIRGRRSLGLATTLTGCALFIETNISILATGSFARSLFDRFKMSREQLAYVLDSTSSPVSVLILLNAWGAYVLAMLTDYPLGAGAVTVLIAAIPLNFYAILTLIGVFYTAASGKVYGPMKSCEAREPEVSSDSEGGEYIQNAGVLHMVLPMCALVLGMFGFMIYTGEGDILAGSGSQSVLWSVSLAIVVAAVMQIRKTPVSSLSDHAFRGMSTLLPVVVILLLSMAIGGSLKDLGTGPFLAGIIGDHLPHATIPALIFIVSGAISFSTGTSWGTFAIMIPIAIPIAIATPVPPPLALAAVLGGGVFGDHCSPISDSTVVSSLAAGCDHIDHVRTQLPYALATGSVAVVLYLVFGWLMAA